jgi:hypothetical protein
MIWPAIGADLNAMAAPIIGAIHQQAANAHLPHFAQGDFPRPFHQSPSFAGSSHRSKSEPEQLPKTVLSSGNPMQKAANRVAKLKRWCFKSASDIRGGHD